jgi:C-terminal processing protease CtpA/Prc
MRSILFLPLVFSLCLSSLATAQQTLQPSLGVAFPVKTENEKLIVSSSVLINPNDLLPPGTVLHRLFPKPKKDDKDVKERKNKDYNVDSYAAIQRFAIENREVNKDKTAVMKALEDRAGGDAMTSELKFRATLHRMNIEEYYLAYDLPGAKERNLGQFDYPEGLLLSEQEGKIVALAVLTDSLAEKLGVVPGSVIVGLNGVSLKSLVDFRDRYFKEKEQKSQQKQAVSMSVLLPEQTAPRDIEFKIKRSLGNAEDMMSDLNANMSKKAEETAGATPEVKEGAKKKAVQEDLNVPLIP